MIEITAPAYRRALAPIALMGLIFVLSAQTFEGDLSTVEVVIRKLGHMGEFGLLTVLWWWALRPFTRRALPVAALISLLYAFSDEFHQGFVEGRHSTLLDVGIDAVGIAVAAFAVRASRARSP
ncbi:MAG: VanZ family protein [Solirubrobacterales bacterium]